MTGRTTGQNVCTLDVIGLHQVSSLGNLFLRMVLGAPVHIENLFPRSHKVFRITMTLQAPLHLQRRRLVGDGHLIDPTVTGRTAHALVDMNAVIEISEVRKIVHAYPLQRLAAAKTRAHRLEISAIGPDLLVTVHAGAGRRHAGGSRRLDRRVTVAAVDAVIADVMFVAELNWLLALDPLPGNPSRAIDRCGDPQRRQQNEDGAEDCRPC